MSRPQGGEGGGESGEEISMERGERERGGSGGRQQGGEEKGAMAREKENSLYADFPPRHHQRVRVTECVTSEALASCCCLHACVYRAFCMRAFALSVSVSWVSMSSSVCSAYRACVLSCVRGCLQSPCVLCTES